MKQWYTLQYGFILYVRIIGHCFKLISLITGRLYLLLVQYGFVTEKFPFERYPVKDGHGQLRWFFSDV